MADTFLKKPIIGSLCKAMYQKPTGQHCGHDRGDTMDELPRAEDNGSVDMDGLIGTVTVLLEEMKTLKDQTEMVKGDIKALCHMFLDSVLESMIFMEANIDHQKVQMFTEMMDKILALKERESDLSQEIKRVEDLCSQVDPVAFMQNLKSYEEKTEHQAGLTKHQAGPPPQDTDIILFSLIFKKNMENFANFIHRWLASYCPHLRYKASFLLNKATVGRGLLVSPTGRAVWYVESKGEPGPGRFKTCNVLGDAAFSSGKHYWEVNGSKMGVKSVGVAYPSMEKEGLESYLGYNQKSWCLTWCCGYMEVCHDSQRREVASEGAEPSSVAVYLDYQAGRISFYRIHNPIGHLYTFFASFTEPLHPAFYVVKGSIKINC
ncbi:zinc-binding protein A33-like [Phyllobates terribilis]|uniref:zinc-binding protein A33-like n=1 Tax=Phyllobates terribilis TaxID=111132 RepID=UPI003CCAB31B